jgi:hypothetical protein
MAQHGKGIVQGSEELKCDIDSWGVIASRLEGIMTNKDCDIRMMIKKRISHWMTLRTFGIWWIYVDIGIRT